MRKSRRGKHASSLLDEVSIPDKLYFRIGEVSELTGTKAYVLRYWESEFPMLKPAKGGSGQRTYRRQDVETVLAIKRLLYAQGFTIEGARRKLAGESRGEAQEDGSGQHPSKPSLDGMRLKALKRELQSILTMLSRKC